MEMIDFAMPRGSCPTAVFEPSEAQDAPQAIPTVLMFMDAFGPRPALYAIAERLAGEGYRVLVPNLFYHQLPFAPFDAATTFTIPAERERLMGYFGSVTQATIEADVAALLGHVAERWGEDARIGCTGYCMGGRYALTAAVTSPRVVLAAAFHSSGLAPEQGDSAHRRLAEAKARIYVGVAGIDASFPAAEAGRLAEALREAGTDYVIENYAGAQHGYAMADLPVYDETAADRHWRRLVTNLAETMA